MTHRLIICEVLLVPQKSLRIKDMLLGADTGLHKGNRWFEIDLLRKIIVVMVTKMLPDKFLQ